MIFLALYFIIETVNVFYTVRFGIKDRFDQPLRYKEVRFCLRIVKYLFVVIAAIVLLTNGTLMLGAVVLLLPYIVEKLLYLFCRYRAIKKGVDALSNKSGKYDELDLIKKQNFMSYEEAERITPKLIDEDIKRGRMFF